MMMDVSSTKLIKNDNYDHDDDQQQALFDAEEDGGEDDDGVEDEQATDCTEPLQTRGAGMDRGANAAGSALIPLFNANTATTSGDRRRRQRNLTSADELPMGTLDIDKPKHSYWRYFRRDRATARAECRMCGRSIQMGEKSSTGGMRRHMQSLHFGVFVEFIAERAAHPRGAAQQTQQRHQQQMPMRKLHRAMEGHHAADEVASFGRRNTAATAAQHADRANRYLGFGPTAADFGNVSASSSRGSATIPYVGVAAGGSNNNNRRIRHAVKTKLFTPPSSSSSSARVLEASLQNSLRVLLNHHHHGVGDDHSYSGDAGFMVDGESTAAVLKRSNDNSTIANNSNNYVIINDGGAEFSLSPPATSQDLLHQMVFSSTTRNNNNNNSIITGGGVDNVDDDDEMLSPHQLPSTISMMEPTAKDVQHATTTSSSTGVKLSLASSSSLREISDAELIGRLQIARERLKDAMDMIDSLQHELTIRQQLRENLMPKNN